jgi:hypothetical protein
MSGDSGIPAFQCLGQAIEFSTIKGGKPDSVIFRVTIACGSARPDGQYTIEFFAEPDMSMVLLRMLDAIRKKEGWPIPEGAIELRRWQ